MKSHSTHFEKSNLKKEYMEGAIWLLEHGFSPRGLWPSEEFYGVFLLQTGYPDRFVITAKYHNNVGWEISIGKSQYGNVIAIGVNQSHTRIPEIMGETLEEALNKLDEFIEKKRHQYELFIMKEEKLNQYK